MEYSSQPREWLSWKQLTGYEQDCLKARYGREQCREMAFLRCPTSRYVLTRRTDDFRDYVVATGEELAACGITGYSSEHLWVIFHGEFEAQVWKRLLRKMGGIGGSIKQECNDLVVAYRNGTISYKDFIDGLIVLGPDANLLGKIRQRLHYKPGWEKYILQQVEAA
jgi:hypothetical protein